MTIEPNEVARPRCSSVYLKVIQWRGDFSTDVDQETGQLTQVPQSVETHYLCETCQHPFVVTESVGPRHPK